MMNRTVMAMVRLVDRPHKMKQIMVLVIPRRMIGLRPNRSDALPQGTAAMLCATEKMDPVKPAHFATSFFGTPKFLIISGR